MNRSGGDGVPLACSHENVDIIKGPDNKGGDRELCSIIRAVLLTARFFCYILYANY